MGSVLGVTVGRRPHSPGPLRHCSGHASMGSRHVLRRAGRWAQRHGSGQSDSPSRESGAGPRCGGLRTAAGTTGAQRVAVVSSVRSRLWRSASRRKTTCQNLRGARLPSSALLGGFPCALVATTSSQSLGVGDVRVSTGASFVPAATASKWPDAALKPHCRHCRYGPSMPVA